ncbi:MAG: histone deacetylase [Chloroflexota bacterium]
MNKTAIVYDPIHIDHTLNGHPEYHQRVETAWALLEADGILDQLHRLPSRTVAVEDVERVHRPGYLQQFESISVRGGGRMDADTYVTAASYDAATTAAGSLLNTVDAVLTGEVDNSFSLMRPPGHHALPHIGMGFCLLGNVAIAARYAQTRHGVERVMIVDYDVHHGNGTQDMFYDDPSVLFFSTHQYPFYPGSGGVNEVGSEMARGTTINVPLPAYVSDDGYLEAFRRVLMPAARAYRPDMIILSAGYDAHWMDPLSTMGLSIGGYTQLTREVMALADELCDGRLVCALEGGYHLEATAHCVLSTLRSLLDPSTQLEKSISDPFGEASGVSPQVDRLLNEICTLHGL